MEGAGASNDASTEACQPGRGRQGRTPLRMLLRRPYHPYQTSLEPFGGWALGTGDQGFWEELGASPGWHSPPALFRTTPNPPHRLPLPGGLGSEQHVVRATVTTPPRASGFNATICSPPPRFLKVDVGVGSLSKVLQRAVSPLWRALVTL